MLLRLYRWCRWSALAVVLTGGMLFQTTGCSTFLASAGAGLAGSISDALIRNTINQALGLGTLTF